MTIIKWTITITLLFALCLLLQRYLSAADRIVVADHGPFAWGPGPAAAVANAVMLEHVALLAGETIRLEPYPKGVSAELLSRHFSRKHGPGAYYGQK